MNELLKCPFCGGEAYKTSRCVDDNEYFEIRCRNCGANIQRADFGFGDSVEQAWNGRADNEKIHA